MRTSLYLLILFLLSAESVMAAVSINEVAWMGGTASANHEWIELYNSGDSSVSVDGWVLQDGMNFSITLTGSIGAGSYAVLERSSDASAPGTAFLIYTGALVNTGATLTLLDASSAVVDQVSGGEDWKNIGGDNTTKETAQYQTSGWVTDTGTPGQTNGSGRVDATPTPEEEEEEENPSQTNTTTNNSTTKNSKSSESVRLKIPNIKLNVLPDVQSVAYEHQAVPFNVKTAGVDDELEKLVRYEWNFGDSKVADGKNPFHTYSYPGTYVVTVRAEYKKNIQVARHEITVLPVKFSITKTSAGSVQINNDAKYDVDISGYTLRGTKEIIFPPRTIMASQATITIGEDGVSNGGQEMIGLYNTKNKLVASSLPAVGFAGTAPLVLDIAPAFSKDHLVSAVPSSDTFGFGLASAAEASGLDESQRTESISITPAEAGVENGVSTTTTNRSMYFLFIALLLLAFVSVLWPRTKNA